jgi:hypothetical protein
MPKFEKSSNHNCALGRNAFDAGVNAGAASLALSSPMFCEYHACIDLLMERAGQ